MEPPASLCERGFCELGPATTVMDRHWLHAAAHVPGEVARAASPRAPGKWLVFVPKDRIDDWWKTVVKATQNGLLGPTCKVSTSKPNPNATDPSTHVICVYTVDSNDETDVRRVRGALRDIGVTWTISYKTDAATVAGKYRVRGHQRISKYRE